jgi:hypothetical protein
MVIKTYVGDAFRSPLNEVGELVLPGPSSLSIFAGSGFFQFPTLPTRLSHNLIQSSIERWTIDTKGILRIRQPASLVIEEGRVRCREPTV